jgi:ABC-type multidrug transport system ATPase subunit/nucleoside phosphorylase
VKTSPDVVRRSRWSSAEGAAARRADGDAPVDVLILTALEDELNAVRDLAAGWEERADPEGFPYLHRDFDRGPDRAPLVVAAAWLGKTGRVPAAIRGAALIKALDPPCVAMCGICAGMRGETALGDVIIADVLYSYDEGKVISAAGKEPEMQPDIRTHELHPHWSRNASKLRARFDLEGLQKERPASKLRQRRLLLEALYAHAHEAGPDPARPGQEAIWPDLDRVIADARADSLVTLNAGELALTEAGRALVLDDRKRFRNTVPDDADLRIHIGTIGTGAMVQKDPELFERLRRRMRSTIGVEMEGAAIGALAQQFDKRGIVVKAVSDHGDLEKDDTFRKFACKASAEVLIAFLLDLDPGVLRSSVGGSLAPAGADTVSARAVATPASPSAAAKLTSALPGGSSRRRGLDPSSPLILRCVDVRKRYGSGFELPVLTMSVRHGHIVGIVGANGVGKSTILRILARDLAQTSGEVTVATAGRGGLLLLNQLTFVSQDPPRYAGTLREHLRQQAAFYGYDGIGVSARDEAEMATNSNAAAVRFAVEPLDLHDQLDKTWQELSGGYRIRAAIAAALVARPGLLVLDEPLAPLDPVGQSRLLGALWKLTRASGVAIVMSSQHVMELEQLADEMILIHDRRIQHYQPAARASGTLFELTLERAEHGSVELRDEWSREIERRLAHLEELGTLRDGRVVEGRILIELASHAELGHAAGVLAGMKSVQVRDITGSALAVMYGLRSSMKDEDPDA